MGSSNQRRDGRRPRSRRRFRQGTRRPCQTRGASPKPIAMSSAASTSRPVDAGFLRSRLGSLLAVVPLAIWTINHLWNNLSAFKGGAAWQADVTEYPHPLAFFASSVVALLPLALHTVWGVGRLF